ALPRRSTRLPTARRTQPSETQYSSTLVFSSPLKRMPTPRASRSASWKGLSGSTERRSGRASDMAGLMKRRSGLNSRADGPRQPLSPLPSIAEELGRLLHRLARPGRGVGRCRLGARTCFGGRRRRSRRLGGGSSRRTARRRLGRLGGRGRRRRRLGGWGRGRSGRSGRSHGGGAGGVLLGLEALGQLLGQFTRGGGRHLGHDGGQS